MKKQGFTITEMVIALGVAAVIATIVLPMLSSIKPNKELLMFRKAYYRVERAITELVNDDTLYPEPEDGSESTFLANTDDAPYRGKIYTGNSKFCGLLAAKLGAETVNCNFVAAAQENGAGFTTSDGIEWKVPLTNFHSSIEIKFDVNGAKGSNCRYSSTCTKPDTFAIKVFPDGRIEVSGAMEKEYLLRKNVTQDAASENTTLN